MLPDSGLLQGLLLLWITIIKLSLGQIERDIILTPKLAYHIHGKTLYYEPGQNFIQQNESSQVPWEQTLKHVTYLTLNNEVTDKAVNISQYPDYNKFQQSSYIQSHEYIPKFGDIITLARGRLEKLNASNYRFIEGPCSKNCAEEPKLVAHWLVEKIRHRDADRNFRYEMKFSVNPILIDKSDSKREIGKTTNKVRAFILKDDDYPKNFVRLEDHIAQRRYDENKDYVDKLHRFNEIFSKPKYYQGSESSNVQRYTNPKMPELNIGEYVKPVQTSMSRIGHAVNRVVYPTTYRPTYHLKFAKPMNLGEYSQTNTQYNSNGYTKNIAPPVASTHLHHHYYVSKSQLPEAEKYVVNPSYLKDHRGALDIIEQPTTTTISPITTHHHTYHTPPPISNQIPMPPNMNTHIQISQSPYPVQVASPIIQAPPLIYMHPVPITQHVPVYIYPKHNERTENPPPNRPFIQSPKDEGTRYSEPDPLYDQRNKYSSENTLIPSSEENSDMESTSPQYVENNYDNYVGGVRYADNQDESYESVTAQLPSPEHHTIPVPETTSKEEEITPSNLERDITYAYAHSTSTDSVLRQTTIKELDNEASYSHSTSKEEHEQTHTEPLTKTSVITQTSATSSFVATPEALTFSESPTEATKDTSTISVTEEINENQITDEKPKAEKLTTKPTFSEKKVTSKSRYYFYRSTTERPVLKWKPKKTKLTKLNTTPMTTSSTTQESPQSTNAPKGHKYEFERVPVNFTEKIIAVTPTKSDSVPTKQSVSTSISIKVGTEEEERPFVTPTISIPNVELVHAQLKNVKTSLGDIKLYKASDQRRKSADVDDSDEEELTKSIVQHIKSLQ